jgi:hypothetical protein
MAEATAAPGEMMLTTLLINHVRDDVMKVFVVG